MNFTITSCYPSCTNYVVIPMHIHFSVFLYIRVLIPNPDKSLPTAAAIAITAVTCLLVAFIAGTLCGALITVCISRLNKKGHSSKPAPSTQEQQQAAVVYEEVDTQSKKIELQESVAYGPVKQDQTFELKENVAYGPVKQDQTFELKENVAYGPVKPTYPV